MATIPTLAGFTTGEKVTASKLTSHTKGAIEAAVYFKPFCHLYHSAAVSVASGAEQTVTFNTVVEDTDSMADLANNRILIQTAGLYRLTGQFSLVNNPSGNYRYAAIMANPAGGAFNPRCALAVPANLNTTARINLSTTVRLVVGDAVALRGAHNVGSAINTDVNYGGCFLTAEWISK